MQFSFWEDNYLKPHEASIVIGSGIVGLSTAIELRQRFPDKPVLIVERYLPPQGASTKNAGFACFGSVTELLDDLTHIPEEEVIEIIRMRWHGIKMLEERLKSKGITITYHGGKELFDKGQFPSHSAIDRCNKIMEAAIGLENYFVHGTQDDFPTFEKQCIEMKSEGELDAMEMFSALHAIAGELGVKFIYGHSVEMINVKEKSISFTDGLSLSYHQLFICTNGFTRNLFPNYDIIPARNQVCVTEELTGLTWKGVYHYDKGYYYFRRVGDRILLGGARNFDPETEVTDQFEFNETIRKELIRFLHERIHPGQEAQITHWWTGILGMGPSKFPILKEIDQYCYIGARLGGMGVAIGSYLGKKLVDLSINDK
ncbi:MAG: FAD-binding oxidoreductase [Saprospiraceae bacterium]|nr:FAD-binding oxidoreductase [Saprospiraceae bacterium]